MSKVKKTSNVFFFKINLLLYSIKKGCTMYVALFPCNECAKMIIQSGIKSVVYMSDKYSSLNKFIASRRLLNMAGINLRQFIPSKSSISIDFNL